jgi:hypothetical protein
MTIRELLLRRVKECGMSPREAALMLEGFARSKEASLIGWDDIVAYSTLSRDQAERIDNFAQRWMMASRYTKIDEAPVEIFEPIPPLPTERVLALSDPARNGPLVVALAREVLTYRGVLPNPGSMHPARRPAHDGKELALPTGDRA